MSNDKIKVRRRELLLIRLIGVPVLRMIISILKKWAEQTKNEYDDEIVVFLEGLLSYLTNADLFEIT